MTKEKTNIYFLLLCALLTVTCTYQEHGIRLLWKELQTSISVAPPLWTYLITRQVCKNESIESLRRTSLSRTPPRSHSEDYIRYLEAEPNWEDMVPDW